MHVAGFALMIHYALLPFELETIQLDPFEGHGPHCKIFN